MKILMLTPYLPYPLVSGGQIRTYNLLKNLHKQHEVTLFAYIRKDEERQYIKQLEPYCKKIRVFKRPPVWTLHNVLGSQFSTHPLLVTMYRSSALTKAIAQELSSETYNLLHAETFYMMPNIPETSLPKILVVQTIEHLGYREFTRKNKLFFIKPFLYWDVWKIKRWEEFYWKKASRLITMSQDDKQYIEARIPGVGDIDVVENGVDIDFFHAVAKKPTKDFVVLFVGTFKWLPNVEAVTYLVEQVWGRIRDHIPTAKLWIVGNSPTKTIQSYASKDSSIFVKGHIADIRDAYKAANVLLAPVWSGKGTRYKILEAMATNTPIVATSIAVEGLGVEHGKHALIGDDPQTLADHTIALWKDPQQAQLLARNGHTLVEKHYDWYSITKKLDAIYKQVGT